MSEQAVTTDDNPYRPAPSAVSTVERSVAASADDESATTLVPDAPASVPSELVASAALAGSLSTFSLADILTLLATTAQSGELEVVGAGAEGRLWLDGGELSNAHVGAATTIGQAVFELACAADAWFTFLPGIVSSSGQPKVPVGAVLDEVRPQVDEWRELRDAVPLGATVRLSPTPPAQDVQIRSDQWQTLTTVGSDGRTVRAVLDRIGGDQVEGLRTLRELLGAGLVVLEPPLPACSRETPWWRRSTSRRNRSPGRPCRPPARPAGSRSC